MNRYFFYCLLFVFASCQSIKKLYVKFGDAKPELESKTDGVIRLFFDRKGSIYPAAAIPDKKIKKAYSVLTNVYKNSPALYTGITQQYGLLPAASPDSLQAVLVSDYIKKINIASSGKKLVFLVHGYNKHPLKPTSKGSYDLYQVMRDSITRHFFHESFQFVEIYWDGMASANGWGIFAPFNSFNIWDNAQPASNNVGLELRRIFAGLTQNKVYVITHSLGASVVTCALFNVDKFLGPFRQEIDQRQRGSHYPTPVTQFSVGMLAPAIPGKNTFDDLDKRTPPSGAVTDYYDFVVGFNARDIVLQKFINISQRMGSTTLGCLEEEYRIVDSIVNTGGRQAISRIEFKNQRSHSLLKYLGNDEAIFPFLENVLQ